MLTLFAQMLTIRPPLHMIKSDILEALFIASQPLNKMWDNNIKAKLCRTHMGVRVELLSENRVHVAFSRLDNCIEVY